MNTILSTLTSGLEVQMAVFRFRVQLPRPQTCLKCAGGAPKALAKINSNRSFYSSVTCKQIPSLVSTTTYFLYSTFLREYTFWRHSGSYRMMDRR